MPATKVIDSKTILLKPPEEIRATVKVFYKSLTYFHLPLGILLSFIHPLLGIIYLGWIIGDYYMKIHKEIFDFDKKVHYDNFFRIKITEKHFLQLGYKLEAEELDYHLNQIKGKNFKNYLKERAKRVLKDLFWQGWRIVGIAKDLLTRHLWLLGASGAGKTMTIMTGLMFQARQGGGAIFIDGKAEETMNKKLYSILLEEGREHDYYLINCLNVDKYKEHTNTFNPFASFTPAEAVQFLSDIAGGGQGDQAYWKGRGIALLTPATYFVYFRKKHFNEPFSYETIANYLEARSFAFAGAVVYALMMELENRLRSDKSLSYIYQRGKTKIPESEFEYVEIFESYLAQHSDAKEDFEAKGYSFSYLEDLLKLFKSIKKYAVDVATAYWDGMKTAGKLFYEKYSDNIAKMGIYELALANEEIIEEIKKKAVEGGGGQGGMQMGKTQASPILIYAEPSAPQFQTAMQQHQYAQQQWTNTFNFFGLYRHIFGALEPDVDMVDIIRNNKFLYVLLPPLKQSQEVTEFLGKLFVIAISRATATALGGPVEKTNDQDEVLSKQIKPTPPFLVIFDEYGAYPVPGIDKILTQARSIQISAWLSTQDITSARVGGTDENSLKRAWGSTSTKIFLSLKDVEAIKWLEDILPVEEVRQISGIVSGDTVLDEFVFQTKQSKIFDPRNIQAFEKGLSIVFSDGNATLCQMFYADPDPANRVYLKRFQEIV